MIIRAGKTSEHDPHHTGRPDACGPGLLRYLRAALRQQTVRFLIVGGWNTLFGYTVFVTMHLFFSDRLGTEGTIISSYAIALPQSFVVQRCWVFGSSGTWKPQLIRFGIANSTIFAANLIALPLLLRHTSFSAVWGQALFVAGSTAAAYLAHKHFSFRQ